MNDNDAAAAAVARLYERLAEQYVADRQRGGL